MHDPMNQAHTAVAGPPAEIGLPNVAGTEPRTPRIEMAYETVDHFENSLLNSCRQTQYGSKIERWRAAEMWNLPDDIQFLPTAYHRRLESSPWEVEGLSQNCELADRTRPSGQGPV